MSVSVYVLSCVLLFLTPWAVAHQAPLSMKFFRQDYWSELSFPTPEDLPADTGPLSARGRADFRVWWVILPIPPEFSVLSYLQNDSRL